MTDTNSKSPERERIEVLLGMPLPDGMVEDAGTLARAAQAAAQKAGAALPFDARDPTGFTAVLESLAPGGAGRPIERPGAEDAAGSLGYGASAPGAAKDNGRG